MEEYKKLFIQACKYLQNNPPNHLDTLEELVACAGANTYENGWKQWAVFFINQMEKEK